MRTYFAGLLILWSTAFGLPLLTAFTGSLQPLDGDLTRIGGLSERDYGWNDAQLRFDHLATARFRSLEVLARSGVAYDVLVLGDSFSEAGVGNAHTFGYQEWMQSALGLSVATISQSQVDYPRLVCDLAKLPVPPRYVVYQTAERYLEARLRRLESADVEPAECPRAGPPTHPHAATLSPNAMRPFHRETAVDFQSLYATYYSRLQAKLGNAIGYARNTAEKFSLTNRDLFSNTRSDELLVVNEDLDTHLGDVQWARDVVRRLAARMKRESGTTLVLLVSPNKLSAYSAYVKGRAPEPLSNVLRAADVPMADVDAEIAALVAAGYRDVYLPNDTHWGYRGHCAAAHAIAVYLSSPWHWQPCGM